MSNCVEAALAPVEDTRTEQARCPRLIAKCAYYCIGQQRLNGNAAPAAIRAYDDTALVGIFWLACSLVCLGEPVALTS